MSNVPTGENWPYLDVPSLEALKQDHERLKYLNAREMATLRHYLHEAGAEGGFPYRPATTDAVIPARQNGPPIEPGGPVAVQPYKLNSAGELEPDGDTIEIYSWVKTASANPQNEPGGLLWIAIAQDEAGVWWFAGQDCTEAPVELVDQTGTDVDPIPASPGASLGLGFTVQGDDLGIWQMTGAVELDLSAVGNNQDIGVRVYATLDGTEIGPGITTWFFKSSGAIFDVPFTVNFNLGAADVGKVFDVLVERLSGQTTLAARNPAAQYLGPF